MQVTLLLRAPSSPCPALTKLTRSSTLSCLVLSTSVQRPPSQVELIQLLVLILETVIAGNPTVRDSGVVVSIQYYYSHATMTAVAKKCGKKRNAAPSRRAIRGKEKENKQARS
jgi:hypothetical protein